MIGNTGTFWVVVVHERGSLYDSDIALFVREKDANSWALVRLAKILGYKLTGDDEWDWEEVKKLLRDSNVVYAVTEKRI